MNVPTQADHGPDVFGVSDNLHFVKLLNSMISNAIGIHVLQCRAEPNNIYHSSN